MSTALTDGKCKAARPGERPIKLFDGGGLHLYIQPSGRKSWRLKYRFGRKEKLLTLGTYPATSLREAREKREAAKRLLASGIDPSVKAQQLRAVRLSGTMTEPTFQEFADRWIKLRAPGWKPVHCSDVRSSLKRDVFPLIGAMPLSAVEPSDIRALVNAVQRRGAIETAHRVLSRVRQIFELAIVEELVDANPAASMQPILKPVIKGRQPAILQIEQAREALMAFEAEPHQPQVKLASRLLALTAARPGPLRLAQIGEFIDLDGENPRWIIPAAKMKLGKAQSLLSAFDFTLPLSRQAVETVKAALTVYRGDGSYLFPSPVRARLSISDNALNIAYRRSLRLSGRHVPHGWRSSFSTIMNEIASDADRPQDRAIIDLMLAHTTAGVEAAYNRAGYMNRRRVIAQEWADLLTAGLVHPDSLIHGPRG